MWRYIMSVTLSALGRDDEALSELRKAVELDPQFWLGWTYQSLLHAMHGRHPESLTCAEKGVAGAPWAPQSTGALAGALANNGRRRDAEPLLAACGATRRSDPWVLCATTSLVATPTALSNGRRRRPTSVLPVSSRS